jgi:NAD(P)-dependent dehydrogenase (short-subunit alcohol dehydrogenase family)
VAAFDIDEDALQKTTDEVNSQGGGSSTPYRLDVGVREDVEKAFADVAKDLGGVDIVVSNAGLVNDYTTLEETDDDEWDRMFSVNVLGTRNVCRAACPLLKASSHGRVVIISSMWGQVGPGHSYSYVAAKGALLAFAKNLALEMAPFKVTVNAITPGAIHTRMLSDIERELKECPIPIGRVAEPEEVSRLVAFLVSDAAEFMTGQTVGFNGGALIVGV